MRAVTRVEMGACVAKVGVTVKPHSLLDMIAILFSPQHNMSECVTNISNLKAESHGSNPG